MQRVSKMAVSGVKGRGRRHPAGKLLFLCMGLMLLVLGGCASAPDLASSSNRSTVALKDYLIGPGDTIDIFVWRNPDVSVTVSVRPDGKISAPLVTDMVAMGKAPSQLAQDITAVLKDYIKDPMVTVIVREFGGLYDQQIRVVGQAAHPQALPYRESMTLLDVMIAVGGLTEFAAGDRASIIRMVDGKQKEFRVHIEQLMKEGDIRANVQMLPGDILIIPESWF